MRVLGESYKMNAGYLSIGYTGTDMGGSFFLPKIVGYARACEILMNPARFDAQKLYEWGFANRVVADDDVLETADGHGRGDVPRDRALRSRLTKEPCSARWTAPASRTASRWRTATRCWPPNTNDGIMAR